MNRRSFIAGIGSAAARPIVAYGQQPKKVYRVAWITPSAPVSALTENSSIEAYRAFLSELRRLGYVEGQNLVLDRYSGEGQPERYADLVRGVVARRPDLIFTVGNAITHQLQTASTPIPIVVIVADPVASGFSAVLDRPTGNITGVSIDPGIEIWGKRLALLKEMAPRLSRPAFVRKATRSERTQLAPLHEVATRLGISLCELILTSSRESSHRRVLEALKSISEEPIDAFVVSSDAETFANRKLIVELAKNAKLPAIFPYPEIVPAGGLMAYGANVADTYRQAAQQIDQLLRGALPSDVPFLHPTKFEVVINLESAKALGLEIPATVLARADKVIE